MRNHILHFNFFLYIKSRLIFDRIIFPFIRNSLANQKLFAPYQDKWNNLGDKWKFNIDWPADWRVDVYNFFSPWSIMMHWKMCRAKKEFGMVTLASSCRPKGVAAYPSYCKAFNIITLSHHFRSKDAFALTNWRYLPFVGELFILSHGGAHETTWSAWVKNNKKWSKLLHLWGAECYKANLQKTGSCTFSAYDSQTFTKRLKKTLIKWSLADELYLFQNASCKEPTRCIYAYTCNIQHWN